MGGITSSFNLSVGSGLSGAGTVASPLTNAGVTSVATGNGLSGGTITTSGTLTVTAPTANTVGSYVYGRLGSFSGCINFFFGSNYTAAAQDGTTTPKFSLGTVSNSNAQGGISGTWKWMTRDGRSGPCGSADNGIAVRVS